MTLSYFGGYVSPGLFPFYFDCKACLVSPREGDALFTFAQQMPSWLVLSANNLKTNPDSRTLERKSLPRLLFRQRPLYAGHPVRLPGHLLRQLQPRHHSLRSPKHHLPLLQNIYWVSRMPTERIRGQRCASLEVQGGVESARVAVLFVRLELNECQNWQNWQGELVGILLLAIVARNGLGKCLFDVSR